MLCNDVLRGRGSLLWTVLLAAGFAVSLYAGQGQNPLVAIVWPDSVDEASADENIPAPELSPSTYRLVFSDVLPGESRTLFLGLVNLGEGEIVLDSLSVNEELVLVKLPLQGLRPGQFVRFPVTLTQADLEADSLELGVHWRSPRFGVTDILRVKLLATARPPLAAEPAVIQWPRGYVGARYSRRLVLHNMGPLPIIFTQLPRMPPDVEVQLPQFLAGETSAAVTVVWQPADSGRITHPLEIPYLAGGLAGEVRVELRGRGLQPARFAEDTLDVGKVYAGSRYRRQVVVENASGHTVVLRRGRSGKAGELGAEVATPAEMVVSPGQRVDMDVIISPHRAGPYRARILFEQRLVPTADEAAEVLPALVLTVVGEVALPLEAAEDRIEFGPRPVLETTLHPIAVTNRGAAPLSMSADLAAGVPVFSFPPLAFNLAPGDRLNLPLYFRPADMKEYSDTAVLRYETFGESQELRITLRGEGLDRPLLRLGTIRDVALEEDFIGEYPIADLTTIFGDANHVITYRIANPFGNQVALKELDGQLLVATTPDFHGVGRVVVQAMNALGHVVADTFKLTIKPTNDLPRRGTPLTDIILKEDSPPAVVGRLSEIFIDPDRALDTVVTHYAILSPSRDDGVRLLRVGDQLVLSVQPDWHGSRSFVVSARDAADTNVVVFDALKVTILPENDPPVVDSLPELELAEDDTAMIAWHPYVRDVDDDRTALTLRFSAVGGGPLPLAFERGEGLTTVVRPRPDWFGEVDVRLTVSDADGAQASGVFTVRVDPVNDPPDPFRLTGPMTLEWEQRLRYAGRDTLITFAWEASHNRDPGDGLFYTWQLLDTSGERLAQELPAGPETSVTAYLDSSGIYLWTVLARDSEGAMTSADTALIVVESLAAPLPGDEEVLTLTLGPNYPNPFSARTSIAYTIPRYSAVALTVYDAMGRKVRVLRAAPQYRGRYVAEWDGRDREGQRVASGPYVAELRAGAITAYLKLVVVH